MRSGLRPFHIAPSANARIDRQLGKSFAVDVLTLALDLIFIPVKSKPLQILNRLFSSTCLVSRMVQILHPKNHLAAQGARAQIRNQECSHIPKMKRTCGAWR